MTRRWADPLTADGSGPMSPGEREVFEREVRDQVEEISRRIERNVPNEPRETRSVGLEGDYPDTRVIVEWWNRVDKRERRRSYRIWHESSWSDKQGRHADAQYIGNFIATWVHES